MSNKHHSENFFYLSNKNFLDFFLKALLRTIVPYDVTVSPFLVSFSQLPAVKKDIKNGATVTSLRTFIRSNQPFVCKMSTVVSLLTSKGKQVRVYGCFSD